jgi:hypothetical protein
MGRPQLERTVVERDQLAGKHVDGPFVVRHLGRRELGGTLLEWTQLVRQCMGRSELEWPFVEWPQLERTVVERP